MKTPRRRARELAVQALYQAAVNSIPAAEAAKNIREMAEFGKADEGLFSKLVIGTADNAASYMQQIRPLLDRDEKDLSPIERAVLLMACHELSAMPETPYPVIINEAIEVTTAAPTATNSSTASSTASPSNSVRTIPNAAHSVIGSDVRLNAPVVPTRKGRLKTIFQTAFSIHRSPAPPIHPSLPPNRAAAIPIYPAAVFAAQRHKARPVADGASIYPTDG